MMRKKWCWTVIAFVLTSLFTTTQVASSESQGTFRQESGLQAYVPPQWFLKGYFLAREKNPNYLFGPVQEFVKTLGGTPTWLIEDMELERIKSAIQDGQKIEYTIYLEMASKNQTAYWVFVVFPFESTQMWYAARRAFHGRKAEAYYGKTKDELERAALKGFKARSELRFRIENNEISSQVPEDMILGQYNCKPVLNLATGRKPDQ
ncbi:conserved hypothetical protein [delta proteobacterium NaphS2]|nr:conserved hypothetical protein [delta proteobacterium NaphS2]